MADQETPSQAPVITEPHGVLSEKWAYISWTQDGRPVTANIPRSVWDALAVAPPQPALRVSVQRRQADVHVCLADRPGIWESGQSPAEAIGELVLSQPEAFGVQIEGLST